MFKGDPEVPLVAALDNVIFEDTKDPWYCRRFREVAENANAFTDWKIIDGQLFYLKPRATTSAVVDVAEFVTQVKFVVNSIVTKMARTCEAEHELICTRRVTSDEETNKRQLPSPSRYHPMT